MYTHAYTHVRVCREGKRHSYWGAVRSEGQEVHVTSFQVYRMTNVDVGSLFGGVFSLEVKISSVDNSAKIAKFVKAWSQVWAAGRFPGCPASRWRSGADFGKCWSVPTTRRTSRASVRMLLASCKGLLTSWGGRRAGCEQHAVRSIPAQTRANRLLLS